MDQPLRALSIKQPYAWLILHGGKEIENRTWKTNRRGTILVHASRRIDYDAFVKYAHLLPPKIETGGIVGQVDIVDCVTSHPSKWFEGPFGFVLANPKPTHFLFPCKGQLMFFEPKLEVEPYEW